MNKKIFIAEDDANLLGLMRDLFEVAGFEVFYALSLPNAIWSSTISSLKRNDVKIAIVDGNLGHYVDTPARDGKIIAYTLRKEIKDITIIAHSGMIGIIDWADYKMDKFSTRPRDLLDKVNEILKQKENKRND